MNCLLNYIIVGRGVFAMHPIEPGDFVLEYRGKLLTQEECQSRQYSEIESTFLFDFEWQNHRLCLDASEEDGSLGRLVNDNHKNPNCIMKKIIVNNKPHLCLFSLKKIEIGDEIDYSYSDAKWPWHSKVKKKQAPAAAEETETSPVHQMFHEETNTQVKALQTPAAAEETETSPVHQMFHEESKPDETNTQVFTVQGFSLIDYPDSDETDEDCMENESLTPHPDVVLRQNTENIMNDIGPDVSDHLYDDETVVKETCDEASQNNHSNEQSDDELVPPLRRTKSILMDRVQDFTHCLYDSSSDSAEDTFNLKPERDSQRLRRSSRCPRPLTQRDLYKRTLKMSVCQEKRGQKMWSACHPGTDVPPRYKFKTRKCLQMSVCQEKRGQKMKPACHPCKNVPPHHKSKTGVSLQKREENKVLSKEAGPQTSVLQWTDI
ncbi:hypothetical protein ABVT39_003470 [Epinephelus coioides]